MSDSILEMKPSWYAPEIIGKLHSTTQQSNATGNYTRQTIGEEKDITLNDAVSTKLGNFVSIVRGTNTAVIGGLQTSFIGGNVANVVLGPKEDAHLAGKAEVCGGPVNFNFLSTVFNWSATAVYTMGPIKKDTYSVFGYKSLTAKGKTLLRDETAAKKKESTAVEEELIASKSSSIASERRSGGILDQIIAMENHSSSVSNVKSSLFQSCCALESHI